MPVFRILVWSQIQPGIALIKRYSNNFKQQSLNFALLLSALLHALMIGLLLFFWSARPMLNLDRTIVTIHLAKLGKKRDEKLLPRFDASEPLVKEAPEEKIAEPEQPQIAEKKIKAPPKKLVPSEKSSLLAEPKKKHVNPLDLLKKRFGKSSDEGLESGSALGTSLQQDLQDSYAAQVAALIKQSYNLPAVLRNQQNQLVVWVRLRINSQGKLLKAEIIRSSGKAMFDNAVLVGVKKIDLFGVPPLQLRRMIATVGFELEFAP